MIPHNSLWSSAPELPFKAYGEVHVWRADLNQDSSTVQSFADVLSSDERQRAARYHFQRDREHYIVARGILRMILSRYLNQPPRQLRFLYNGYGKPALTHGAGDATLRFNVSHAHGIALYAITWEREIGIDIEFMRDNFASLEIAERFFSPHEVAMLRALAHDSRTIAFFNCWTRKEAYIKAQGEGLSRPLDRFTVSLAPGEPASLLSTDDDPQEASNWSLIELSPGQGYCAALAVEGKASVLRCWHYAS